MVKTKNGVVVIETKNPVEFETGHKRKRVNLIWIPGPMVAVHGRRFRQEDQK